MSEWLMRNCSSSPMEYRGFFLMNRCHATRGRRRAIKTVAETWFGADVSYPQERQYQMPAFTTWRSANYCWKWNQEQKHTRCLREEMGMGIIKKQQTETIAVMASPRWWINMKFFFRNRLDAQIDSTVQWWTEWNEEHLRKKSAALRTTLWMMPPATVRSAAVWPSWRAGDTDKMRIFFFIF
jgi:hypothetical protein